MKIFITFILLFCCSTGAYSLSTTDPAVTLAHTLDSLPAAQRLVLYQYGTLKQWAGDSAAARYWQANMPAAGSMDTTTRNLLAAELQQSARLEFSISHPSRIQALRGVFTTSRLLLGLAALVAAAAIIQLLSKYLPNIFQWLRVHLTPLIRWLFNPRALSWEMLVIGMLGVYFGPLITETVIRTIVIHLGIFFIWSQLTAILTRRYTFKYYSPLIKEIFEGDTAGSWLAFLYVSLPAMITAAAISWAFTHTSDPWFAYEIIVPLMISIFALPPLQKMERIISRLIFPFPHYVGRTKDIRLAAYVTITLLVWAAMVLIPVNIPESILVLSIVLTLMLLALSIEDITRCGIPNFIWIQLLTLCFCTGVILTGTRYSMLPMIYTGLGGFIMYVLIKYWEIPTLFGWKWKNSKAWGALGMAVLIWGIAVLLRSHAAWFAFIK
ncbi:hypothetical protein [Chitinophaga sp. Cy-1792]|uniref:hypothetical protein n=1 Tax=Chitinophaga sp. Cy-1792 TaxID=2608339 RepID=UPI00141DE3B8|nr:hypothetical protein [Chitinophaga sp. Cy-1792]NIG55459.1 hypothetical protein [Chitinophaga sp. Cy-1792]